MNVYIYTWAWMVGADGSLVPGYGLVASIGRANPNPELVLLDTVNVNISLGDAASRKAAKRAALVDQRTDIDNNHTAERSRIDQEIADIDAG